MPMPGNYNWRPNDNSSQTNLRYDLEAEKWVKSIRSAKLKYKRPSFSSDLGAIGVLLSLPLLLLAWIILIPIYLIREVVGYNIKLFPGDEPTGWVEKDPMARYDVDPKEYHKPEPKKLTNEEMEMVRFVQQQTAKAKG